MPRRRATISDVASQAGVSKGLVSLALNGRPGVAPETRQRILAAVAELGWAPSRGARGLSLSTTFTVGLVLRRDPTVIAADPFFPHFIAGVESVLAPRGWTLALSVVADAEVEDRTYRSFADHRRVDGVFLTDLRVREPRIRLLAELGLPYVVIGRPATAVPGPTVVLDDRAGIDSAVRHLAAAGHNRIAHVSGDPALVHGRSRRAAFVAAMQDCGLDPGLVVAGDFSAPSGAAATARLLEDDRPTAIVYANDLMAIAGLGVLQAVGLAVPGEMSLTGFDGVDIGAYVHPALSTVVANAGQWGAEAARTMLAVLDGAGAADVQLPAATFLDRGSTGPPQPARTSVTLRPLTTPYSHPLT